MGALLESRRVHLLRGSRSRASRSASVLAVFRGWREREMNAGSALCWVSILGVRTDAGFHPWALGKSLPLQGCLCVPRHSVSRDEMPHIFTLSLVHPLRQDLARSGTVPACRDHVYAVPPAAPSLSCCCLLLLRMLSRYQSATAFAGEAGLLHLEQSPCTAQGRSRNRARPPVKGGL